MKINPCGRCGGNDAQLMARWGWSSSNEKLKIAYIFVECTDCHKPGGCFDTDEKAIADWNEENPDPHAEVMALVSGSIRLALASYIGDPGPKDDVNKRILRAHLELQGYELADSGDVTWNGELVARVDMPSISLDKDNFLRYRAQAMRPLHNIDITITVGEGRASSKEEDQGEAKAEGRTEDETC